MRQEDGFTLIELLVVIIVIAILAAIAIPLFLEKRVVAMEAQQVASIKNAATAVEAFAVDHDGKYIGLDEETGDSNTTPLAITLEHYGFKWPTYYAATGYMSIEASSDAYCILVRHDGLTATSDWQMATYESSVGRPETSPDSCPEL